MDHVITESVVSDSDLFEGSSYFGVAITPDGSVYVANPSTNTVYVLDPFGDQRVHPIIDVGSEPPLDGDIGSKPVGVAASPDGRFVYVTNRGTDEVTVIDAKQDPPTVMFPRIAVGKKPIGAGCRQRRHILDA